MFHVKHVGGENASRRFAAADQSARTREAAILKTLGAARAQILASIALRAILLGTAAGGVALAAGIGGGWAVSHFVMETPFTVIWPSALGIVAAVLGVVKAMGAIDSSPEILGGLIGAALVGTFVGIFLSYAVVGPVASKLKIVREQNLRIYFVAKQTLIAFMNGAMPQIALEFGRKAISAHDRPSIDQVEEQMMNAGAAA